MLIMGQNNTAAHFDSKERATEVMRDIWAKAQAGQGFYEIPSQ